MRTLYSAAIGALAFLAVFETVLPAHAAQLSATVTTDNHYGLYSGQADGSGLSFVGRNEEGNGHIPDLLPPTPSEACSGTFNWQCPESWAFEVNSEDHVYVVAWDTGLQQSWIGEFQLPDSSLLLSNTSDWEYAIASGSNPLDGAIPSLLDIATEIANATWSTPQASAPQGTSPWGTIPGISASAQFVWHDTLDSTSTSDANYVIFRSKAPVFSAPTPPPVGVLEPATTVGLGLLGMACLFTKRKGSPNS
ncbi:PEP-CTERM sorting domain-containing protein [Oscillatoria sp. FACHB-1407]|uniref:PEP-CTERM sorting domain-containing protein n=1 Tax=Oscillatoria sp. FACHB-1407 TaxID=2692847 RepID=UPI001683F108|nr:PEP-CTERM sorting domain-containing protein [Oscillatoria sp. FACHB-1407]MBD2465804.1 PEP-CTERM sorting domain-containing protein [Oscillatoria sp. FACHB-1407]